MIFIKVLAVSELDKKFQEKIWDIYYSFKNFRQKIENFILLTKTLRGICSIG
ncbi:hypothetical protein HanIR_Chr17g0891051 [Helianthus annuus]|nr:hypothetical protein HanIR_Chr17g0891051 [Helianthus annuus]